MPSSETQSGKAGSANSQVEKNFQLGFENVKPFKFQDDTSKYRQLLVRTLHTCCIKFPDTAPNVIPLLMEFLSDSTDDLAAQVRTFFSQFPISINFFFSFLGCLGSYPRSDGKVSQP